MFRAWWAGISSCAMGIIPANADATPTWLETWAAGTSLEATLHREAQDTNPVTLTDDNLIAAIKLYGQHCAICHGTAKGDPSASPVAKGLYPRPFCRPHPIRFPSSLWGTMASAEPTRTNYAQSIFGTGLNEGRVIQRLLVDWSWPVAKSGVFTIRPVRICTRKMLTSPST
jgi:mono/diheme cytochrome c family protein